MRCPKCDQAVPGPTGRAGRPAVYCSTPCRRAAGYEIRRVQRALEAAEEMIRRHRTSIAMGERQAFTCCLRATAEHVAVLDAERDRLEERLRLLLSQ